MPFVIVGMPGRFSQWCEAALSEVAQASGQPDARIESDGLDQLGRNVLLRGYAPTVVSARQPQANFAGALIDADRPFLVALEQPDRVVAALCHDQGRNLADAVRYTASSLAAIGALSRMPRALVVALGKATPDAALIARIAEHFALPLKTHGSEALAAFAARMMADDAPSSPEPDAWHLPEELSALRDWCERPVGNGALQPMWDYVLGAELAEIFWHPALFCLGSDPARAPAGLIDATGSGRCLAFGPYIRLPAGAWSCSLIVGCTKSAAGLRLMVEVFAGSVLGSARFAIGEAGVFEIEVSFVNAAPDVPIEVRLFTTQPAFEGEIGIGGVRMVPLKTRRLTPSAA